jgi:hypothetical protein
MIFLNIIIILLVVIVLFLSMTLWFFMKKNIYLSNKEKEFVFFTFFVFEKYGNELGIQSKDEHAKLVEELEKIKKKINNEK